MKKIKVKRKIKNTFALIDDIDYSRIKKYKWYFTPNGYAVSSEKQINKIKGKAISMHRLIMGTPKGMLTDHINGNKLDNRRENLRVCNRFENMWNVKKRKTRSKIFSRFMGVYWVGTHKAWRAAIKYHNKLYRIGLFKNERHAAMARDIWATYFHGEFAKLNFKSIC